ncbi:hypothetical protein PIB30_060745 [Stylosanthes scabra]|uniref:Uncharacterized protein n=1 Tax=Stylosanthes scabra TaxID=79078 RepID=A0ABU6TKD5_9FABA|nr:hypothetical protein [Stylosanthes scabra]
MTGVPLDLGEAEAETSTPATTSTPVVPTASLAEEDDEPPPPEPDPMSWPPVDNPLSEGEEEDVALEEELARQVVCAPVQHGTGSRCPVLAFFRLQRGYEHRIYESCRMRDSKRLREIMHGIRNKGAPHGWIQEDLWARLVEFWQ